MSNLKQLLEVFQDERLLLPAGGRAERWAETLDIFLSEWARWNDRVNLTSENLASEVIKRHIFDSLQYARAMKAARGAILDIGSGAGFPGIPLKVIFPHLVFVLVESQRKRANFLRNCVRKMSLENVEVLNQRAEGLSGDLLERFDLAVFRGVGDIAYCLKLAGPFLKPGGQAVIKKEPDAKFIELTVSRGCKFQLQDEIFFQGAAGVRSKLMLFGRSFT